MRRLKKEILFKTRINSNHRIHLSFNSMPFLNWIMLFLIAMHDYFRILVGKFCSRSKHSCSLIKYIERLKEIFMNKFFFNQLTGFRIPDDNFCQPSHL